MPVKTRAFVAVRDIGKPVSGFYLENAKNIHRRIVPPMTALRNHFTLSGLETYPGMRAIAEGFAGRLSATAQRSAHFYTLLTELVVQPHTTTKCDRSVFDAGDRDLAWP